MRILNVDDRAENLYLIEVLFRGHGYEVVSARHGEEALAIATAATTRFDAILTDLLMPRMDGFQLITALRRDANLARIPIVVYTATYTDSKDQALALSLGADRFVVKPAEGPDLIRLVEEAIRDRAAGVLPVVPAAPGSSDEVVELKQYNSRLVAKLEKKMLDLEQSNHALQTELEARKRAEVERHRLEEQLRHAHKMEAIGTLAGGIAHDFNNILTGILSAAQLGLRDGAAPAPVRQCLDDILAASQRARDLVKQILAFSRQQRAERQPLDLRVPVAEAIRFLRATLPAGVELQFDRVESLPHVLADPTQIHQIVANLGANAWHALGGRQDGRICLLLEAVEVTPEQAAAVPELTPTAYVRLSISDNGCGMDAATRARIFEPFFTTKAPGVGTGLGLSVVHGIMRSYDGAIVVQTELGQGSLFQLYFPVLPAPPAEPESVAPAAPPARGRGQRVLFVDDEPLLVRLAQSVLAHLGYTPLTFTDPLLALEAFRQDGADVFLMDMAMPGCDGLELARRALACRPNVPVVLMTGFAAGLEPEQLRARGFSGLLFKPYDHEALARVLARVLK